MIQPNESSLASSYIACASMWGGMESCAAVANRRWSGTERIRKPIDNRLQLMRLIPKASIHTAGIFGLAGEGG
jgi:hypothetical protein